MSMISAYYEEDEHDENILNGRLTIEGSQEEIFELYSSITKNVLEGKPKEISDLEYISSIIIDIADKRERSEN